MREKRMAEKEGIGAEETDRKRKRGGRGCKRMQGRRELKRKVPRTDLIPVPPPASWRLIGESHSPTEATPCWSVLPACAFGSVYRAAIWEMGRVHIYHDHPNIYRGHRMCLITSRM